MSGVPIFRWKGQRSRSPVVKNHRKLDADEAQAANQAYAIVRPNLLSALGNWTDDCSSSRHSAATCFLILLMSAINVCCGCIGFRQFVLSLGIQLSVSSADWELFITFTEQCEAACYAMAKIISVSLSVTLARCVEIIKHIIGNWTDGCSSSRHSF